MAAVLQHRELSGAFSDEAKWQECWDQLASDDQTCPIGTLRIYHNSPQQVIGTAQVLLHNSSISQLEIGVVDGPAATRALAELIEVNSSIHTLTIQELHAASHAPAAANASEPHATPAQATPAAAASPTVCPVLQALACNSSIRCLTLHKLQPGQVLQLAAALADGGCENKLQQLNLPGARLDAAAAGTLSAALCKQQQLTHLGLKGASFSCQHEQQQQQQQQQHPAHRIGNNQQPNSTAQGCAVGQLFGALAAHPSLSHVCLQGVTCQLSSSSSSRGGSNGGSIGCRSGGQCWHNLGVYVAAAQQLQELVLSEAGLSDREMQQLGCGLAAAAAAASVLDNSANISSSSSSNPVGLRIWDLSGNSMGLEGAKVLGRGLGLGCQCLESLKLGGSKMGSEGVRGLVEGLTAAAAAATTTEVPLPPPPAAAAAAARRGGMCCLQELDLSSNGITDAAALQQLLSHHLGHGLFTLNVSENCLDDAAVQLIAAALSSTVSSTVGIDTVSSTTASSTAASTGDAAGRPASPRSPSNHTNSSSSSSRVYCCKLSHLNLSHNWIKDGGAKALTALLQYPSSSNLQTLLLNHNRMSRAGIEGLADAAVGNRRVLDLQLHGNRALGRLQALEDLKLVLADRRNKLQQQQQQQQQQRSSGCVDASVSIRGSPSGSPREQQDPAAAAAAAAASVVPAEAVCHTRGSISSSTSSTHHWQSPLLSTRSSGSAAALQSPFAAHGPATAAVFAESIRGGSSSSRARSRSPPAAGYKRGQAEIADGSTAAAADGAGVHKGADTAVGSSRGPKALATNTSMQGEAAAAAEMGAAVGAGDLDADMVDAAAHILVGSSSSSDGNKLQHKAPAAATAATAPSYLHKAAAIAAATAAAAAVGVDQQIDTTTAPAAAAGEGVSFQLPSPAGRFLQQQKQRRLGLGLGERSFSFDQWCEDNALQLGGWGSLRDSVGTEAVHSVGSGSSTTGGTMPSNVASATGRGARSSDGKIGGLTRLAPSTAAAAGVGLQAMPETESLPTVESVCDLQGDSSTTSDSSALGGVGVADHVYAGEGPCQLLLSEEEGSVGSSASTAAAAGSGLLGEVVVSFDGALSAAVPLQAVDGGLPVQGVAADWALQPPAVQVVGRVSSLSGWMTDQVFVQTGRELLLPGVRRKYVFVHGLCDSRDNSGSGSGNGGCGAEGLILRPFGSGVLQQQGGLVSFGSGGLQPGGCGSCSGSGSGSGSRGSGSGNGGSRLSKVVLGSTSRAASGALRLQPKVSAASLLLFGSSDGGGSAGSSRSSSVAEDGVWGVGGASGTTASSSSGDGSGSRGTGLGRQGSSKGVLLVRRGGSANGELGVGGGGKGLEGVASRLSVASKAEA